MSHSFSPLPSGTSRAIACACVKLPPLCPGSIVIVRPARAAAGAAGGMFPTVIVAVAVSVSVTGAGAVAEPGVPAADAAPEVPPDPHDAARTASAGSVVATATARPVRALRLTAGEGSVGGGRRAAGSSASSSP